MDDLAYREWTRIAHHYRKNIPGALFFIGELVSIHCDSPDKRQYTGHTGHVLGMRIAGDEFEYAVSGLEFLVWEHELEA